MILFPFQLGGKVRKPLDNNIYSTKKTVAQGMMDLALLTANASQLKLILKYNQDKSALFFLHVTCIGISIALQVNFILPYSYILYTKNFSFV